MPREGSSALGVKIRMRTVPPCSGRKHERRLGEPELERERLHELHVQPSGIGENAELIPLERPVGEHVHDGVAQAGHGASQTLRVSSPDAPLPRPARARGEGRARRVASALGARPRARHERSAQTLAAHDDTAARSSSRARSCELARRPRASRRRRAWRCTSTTGCRPARPTSSSAARSRASTGRSRSSATSRTARSSPPADRARTPASRRAATPRSS